MEEPTKYTAALFFHGVGDPKRNVSLGSLLDHLDLIGKNQTARGLGNLRAFRYRATASGSEDVQNYVECKHIRIGRGDNPYVARTLRLHEAYWAPETDAKYSLPYILWWFLRRIANSFGLLFASWRKFPGLRMATLCFLSERGAKSSHLEELERLYRDFENWEGRARFPKGRYGDFYKLVEEEAPPAERQEFLDTLARWWQAFQRYNLIMLLKALMQLALIPILLATLYQAIDLVRNPASAPGWLILYSIGVMLIIPAGSVYIWRTLRSHVIDVLTWTIDSERGQRAASRRKIIKYCRATIRKIVDDPNCESCVIVAHSLGSSIAIESILREGDLAKARALDDGLNTIGNHPLKKISDVFLFGSPIDRIFHFFQTDTTFSHRYNRLFEEQRLSLSLPPFWDVGFAGTTKITNFWSRFDPISSQIHSLRKSVAERPDSIRNIEAVPLGIPWPIKTHVTYFSDRVLTEAIFRSLVIGSWNGKVKSSPRAHKIMAFLPWALFPLPFVLVWFLSAPLLGWSWKIPLGLLLLELFVIVFAARRARHWHEDRVGPYLNRAP